MRRLVTGMVIAAAALGCATTPANQTSDRVIARTNEGVMRLNDRPLDEIVHLKVPGERALAAAEAVYRDLGVQVKLYEPLNGTIGNRRFSLYHRLGGVALDQYAGCGMNLIGPGANTYRLTVSLVTNVLAEPTGSSVQTHFSASADDPSTSKGTMSCLSTGLLEQRVNRMIAAKVGG